MKSDTKILFRMGLLFCLLASSFQSLAQEVSHSIDSRNSDSIHINHSYTFGPMITLSGPGSIYYATLVYGGGLQQSYILRKNNRPRFFTDLIFAYLVRNNYFSVIWHDSHSKMYQAYNYLWQASAGWNVNHNSKQDHLMYMGTFITGKIYDSHINRNQYTLGCFFADDVNLKFLKMPLCFIYKMHIPVLDYTESLQTPLFLSKYILNWQYSLGIGFLITKDKITYPKSKKPAIIN